MKIERLNPEFNPVSFTIETQEEADLLLAILAKSNGAYAGDMLYKMFRALGDNNALDVAKFKVTSGNIRIERNV